MKRKLIPPFLMLSVGAVSSIIMHFNYYETNKMLAILLGVMVIFYIAGNLFTMMLNIFDKQNQPEEMDAGDELTDEEGSDIQEGQVKTEG
mgnify:CR=1 FL=1